MAEDKLKEKKTKWKRVIVQYSEDEDEPKKGVRSKEEPKVEEEVASSSAIKQPCEEERKREKERKRREEERKEKERQERKEKERRERKEKEKQEQLDRERREKERRDKEAREKKDAGDRLKEKKKKRVIERDSDPNSRSLNPDRVQSKPTDAEEHKKSFGEEVKKRFRAYEDIVIEEMLTSSQNSLICASAERGFDHGFHPKKVVFDIKMNGKVFLLMEWKEIDEETLVFLDDARHKCPEVVIKYFKNRVKRQQRSLIAWNGR